MDTPLTDEISLALTSNTDIKSRSIFDLNADYEQRGTFIEDEMVVPIDLTKSQNKITKEVIQHFISQTNKENGIGSSTA